MTEGDLEFSVRETIEAIERLKDIMVDNNRIKDNFISYIDTKMAPYWTTEEGLETIEELRDFVNNDYQEYINYLNDRINALESIIPNLNAIDRA